MASSIAWRFCLPESTRPVGEGFAQYGDDASMLTGGTVTHGLAARRLLAGLGALFDIRNSAVDGPISSGATPLAGAVSTFTNPEPSSARRVGAWLGAIREALANPQLQTRRVVTVEACPNAHGVCPRASDQRGCDSGGGGCG